MKIPCGKNNLTLMASSWGEIGDRLQIAQQILDFKRVAQEQLPSKLATGRFVPSSDRFL